VKIRKTDTDLLSVTRTVNEYAPDAVGVPLTTPELDSVSPAGSPPLVIPKSRGEPPEAASVCE
jgi:hypothetical protein